MPVGPTSPSDSVPPVGSEENAGDDNFSMSRIYKGLCLSEGEGERLAVNKRSGLGYNTVGAIAVAAILDLEKGPGLAPERSEGRQGICELRIAI